MWLFLLLLGIRPYDRKAHYKALTEAPIITFRPPLKVAEGIDLLCLDELAVTNVADAAVLWPPKTWPLTWTIINTP